MTENNDECDNLDKSMDNLKQEFPDVSVEDELKFKEYLIKLSALQIQYSTIQTEINDIYNNIQDLFVKYTSSIVDVDESISNNLNELEDQDNSRIISHDTTVETDNLEQISNITEKDNDDTNSETISPQIKKRGRPRKTKK